MCKLFVALIQQWSRSPDSSSFRWLWQHCYRGSSSHWAPGGAYSGTTGFWQNCCLALIGYAARLFTQGLLANYLEASGHADNTAALFRPIRNNRTGELARGLSMDGVYKLVRGYAQKLGVTIGAHALRVTAATNALEHEADIANLLPA
jgi:hypothetical protein